MMDFCKLWNVLKSQRGPLDKSEISISSGHSVIYLFFTKTTQLASIAKWRKKPFSGHNRTLPPSYFLPRCSRLILCFTLRWLVNSCRGGTCWLNLICSPARRSSVYVYEGWLTRSAVKSEVSQSGSSGHQRLIPSGWGSRFNSEVRGLTGYKTARCIESYSEIEGIDGFCLQLEDMVSSGETC